MSKKTEDRKRIDRTFLDIMQANSITGMIKKPKKVAENWCVEDCGEWKIDKDGLLHCPLCGFKAKESKDTGRLFISNFCPDCGENLRTPVDITYAV